MQIHQLAQGSAEWHAHRAAHFNASDAPAMMGCSPYETRQQLIHRLKTGITPEVDAATQRRFDDGHRFEALARPVAEELIGEQLFPVVGTEGKLSASFDGLTMAEDLPFEHKSLNAELRELMVPGCTGAVLPLLYRIQMEQQCMVSGAARVFFMASKWEGDTLIEERHCWYDADPALAADIAAGWDQLQVDLDAYVPEVAAVPVVAAPMEQLPAVTMRVTGMPVVTSNLAEFSIALRAWIDKIPKKPSTDQEFADADAAVKRLKDVEDAIGAAEENALASMADVNEMRRLGAELRELARQTRLSTGRLVEARKGEIRLEHLQDGQTKLGDHLRSLNARIGFDYMPQIPADFAGAIKGKKTVKSLRDAIAQVLANAKIAANDIEAKISKNLALLRELASDYKALFPDTRVLVLKAEDDLRAIISARISEAKAAEQKRAEEAAEAARASIRLEEEQRAAEEQAKRTAVAAGEITGIQQQVMIARLGRDGVRKGGTLACIQETLQETVNWPVTEEKFGALYPTALTAKTNAIEAIRRMETAALAAAEANNQASAAAAPAAAPVAPTPAVVPISAARAPVARPAAPPSSTPTLRVGEIAHRLGFGITAAFLRTLGFDAASREGAAQLYHEADFAHICAALIRHIESVQAKQAA